MSGPSSSNVYDVPMTNTPQITLERPTIHDPPETKFRYAQTLYEQSVWNEEAFRVLLTSKSDLEEQVRLLTQQNHELLDRFHKQDNVNNMFHSAIANLTNNSPARNNSTGDQGYGYEKNLAKF